MKIQTRIIFIQKIAQTISLLSIFSDLVYSCALSFFISLIIVALPLRFMYHTFSHKWVTEQVSRILQIK